MPLIDFGCPLYPSKRRHETRDYAKAAIKAMKASGYKTKDLRAFKCESCGMFHVGTQRIHGQVIPRHTHRDFHEKDKETIQCQATTNEI